MKGNSEINNVELFLIVRFAGLVMPVSVWVKKLDSTEPRCVVVMEPVDRTTAKVAFDATVSFINATL